MFFPIDVTQIKIEAPRPAAVIEVRKSFDNKQFESRNEFKPMVLNKNSDIKEMKRQVFNHYLRQQHKLYMQEGTWM